MVEQIPMRTLNQDTAGVLARVARGETVEITNRGRPIARLVPINPDPLTDLVVAGTAVAPTVTGPVPMPTVSAEPGQPDGGELLSTLRDEERW